MYEFYYIAYGQIIKKSRLAQSLTQESVAKSICSNTYISKAENNQVVVGEEQLYLIMERLSIPREEFATPEELVNYLEKVIDYFYYRDIEKYKDLMEQVEGYQYYSVIELIKLGYYILTKDYIKAAKINYELLDYLNSFDDLGFGIYLAFSSMLNIKQKHFKLARYLIKTIYLLNLDYPNLITTINYTKYIAFGSLKLYMEMGKFYNRLLSDLTETGNMKMLNELMVYQEIFRMQNFQKHEFRNLEEVLSNVDEEIANEYLMLKIFISLEPVRYMEYLKDKNNKTYLFALYLSAKQALQKEDMERYSQVKKELADLHYKLDSQIDYANLLNLQKKKDMSFYKEYLISPCLKLAKDQENIFFMEQITESIVGLLQERSRYKDALAYSQKLKSDIKKLQE